jgi:hypothetical protein
VTTITLSRPLVAGDLRYDEDGDGGIRCLCHGTHFETPAEIVTAHRGRWISFEKRGKERGP